MLSNEPLEAFAVASGITAGQLNISIRTGILLFFFLWAAWCVLRLMKHHKNHSSGSITDLLKDYVHVFFLISVVITLVFIS